MKRRLKIKFVDDPLLELAVSPQGTPDPACALPIRAVLALLPSGRMVRQMEWRCKPRDPASGKPDDPSLPRL